MTKSLVDLQPVWKEASAAAGQHHHLQNLMLISTSLLLITCLFVLSKTQMQNACQLQFDGDKSGLKAHGRKQRPIALGEVCMNISKSTYTHTNVRKIFVLPEYFTPIALNSYSNTQACIMCVCVCQCIYVCVCEP